MASALNKSTDVFVIGGGPAGLATAIAARRRRFSVSVADGAEPPIDKPCGEGLMPEAYAALRALGVELPAGEGCRFRGIRFVVGDRSVAADFPVGRGIGIRRPILHRSLMEAAAKLGVTFFWKTPVLGVFGHEVQLRDASVTARWIIGADGSGSRVRRWSGLEAATLFQQRIATRRHYRVAPWSAYVEAHWGPRGQAYVTPISQEEVCVVIMAQSCEDATFETALDQFPQLRERLASAEIPRRERGASTSMHALMRVSRGNVALVGDASGGVDAITGEGLRLAFRHAQALAHALELGDLSHYELAHRRLARRPRWIGSLMLRFGENRWLRERAMATMQRSPELFERLLAIHAGEATSKHLLAVGVQFGWQFLAA